MTKRNRKKQQRDGFVMFRPIGMGIVCATAVALAYVWLGCRCEFVGREIQSLERAKAELGRKYRSEEYRWVQMKAPRNIEKALQQHRMRMDWPRTGQVVHLPETVLRSQPPEPGYWVDLKHTPPTGS